LGVDGIGATTEANGTPVVAFEGGHLFHVGVDPGCPASRPDGTITPSPSSGQQAGPAIVRNAEDGSVWVAWIQAESSGFSDWVERVLPTQGPPLEAPSSFTPDRSLTPLVALAAPRGGGVYMAYCVVPSGKRACVHIDLWKVGSRKPLTVPWSPPSGSEFSDVALAAAPRGGLAIAWYIGLSGGPIHAVETNSSVTDFGGVRRVRAPGPSDNGLDGIQADVGPGGLDVVLNTNLGLFYRQVVLGMG
jgi:hypothetical protein